MTHEKNTGSTFRGSVERKSLVNTGWAVVGTVDKAHLAECHNRLTELIVVDVVEELLRIPINTAPSLLARALVPQTKSILKEGRAVGVAIGELDLPYEVEALGTKKVGECAREGGTESIRFRGQGRVEKNLIGISVGAFDVGQSQIIGSRASLNRLASVLIVGTHGGKGTTIIPVGCRDSWNTIRKTLDPSFNISLHKAGFLSVFGHCAEFGRAVLGWFHSLAHQTGRR